MARCECAGCGEKFGGVSAFDQHQQPAGTCHPPGSRGLMLAASGYWAGKPMDEDALAAFRARAGSARGASQVITGAPGPENASQGRAGAL